MSGKKRWLFLLLLVGAIPARAAFEIPLEVIQPVVTGVGVILSTVTYTHYAGAMHGRSVRFTTAANRVGTQSGFENRNAANLAGLVAGVDAVDGGLHGDTLCVFLDLSNVGEREEVEGWPVEAVVQASVEAVLLNAWKTRDGADPRGPRRTEAHVIRLEMRGSQRFAALAGVYDGKAIAQLPSRGQFP